MTFATLRNGLLDKGYTLQCSEGPWGYDTLFNKKITEKGAANAYEGSTWTMLRDDRKGKFSFVTETGTYCCALPVFGGWDYDDNIDPADAAKLLQMACLVDKRQKVIMASERDTPETANTNKALAIAGFELVDAIPSRHTGAKYKVNIWMWKAK